MKTRSLGLLAGSSLLLVGQAQAAAVDVTALVIEIGSQAAPVALVAMAVLTIFVGMKAFKWIRRAAA